MGHEPQPLLASGFGRLLTFIYGVLAFAASGRAVFELAAKFDEAPIPYALSGLAAAVYLVATWALATDRRAVAWAAVLFELIGVLAVGLSSLVLTDEFPEASVWSDFGIGYGFVPLVLPFLGLVWLVRTRHPDAD